MQFLNLSCVLAIYTTPTASTSLTPKLSLYHKCAILHKKAIIPIISENSESKDRCQF